MTTSKKNSPPSPHSRFAIPLRLFLGAVAAFAFLPTEADAQRGSSSRTLRAPTQRSAPSSRSFGRSAPRSTGRSFTSPRSGRSFGNGNAGGGLAQLGDRLRNNSRSSSRSDRPILDALFGSRNNNRGEGLGRLGDILGNGRYGDYGRDRYNDRDNFSDAYLTVGLAQAAVGLVGVLAENNRYRYGPGQHYNDGCRYCQQQAACPPPQQQQPRTVNERVVVEEGRYEEYQVLVPERYDPNTGQKLGGGFYETRTRYVPPQYAYREIEVGR